jgi:hypothetical protein
MLGILGSEFFADKYDEWGSKEVTKDGCMKTYEKLNTFVT